MAHDILIVDDEADIRRLIAGVVRIAEEHAGDLHPTVEVTKR